MLRLLLAHGCPLHSAVLENAAGDGYLPVLQLLHDQGYKLTADLYYAAARAGHMHVLSWLHRNNIPITVFQTEADRDHAASDIMALRMRSTCMPALMFLEDIGAPLPAAIRQMVQHARKTYCTFHGLLRWCRHAASDPSRGAHRAFDSQASDRSGQLLLVRLSLLPQDLIIKVAAAAGLQHDICLASRPCHQLEGSDS